MDFGVDRLAAYLRKDPDNRLRLAGTVGGSFWLVAAAATITLPLLPQVDVPFWPWPVLWVIGAVLWGLSAMFVLDWPRVPRWVMPGSTLVAPAVVALLTQASGGIGSPTRLYVFLVLVFAACFLTVGQATVVVALCAIGWAVPVFAHEGAAGGLAEAAIALPIFSIIGGLLLGGRSLLGAMHDGAQRDADRHAADAATDPLTGLANHRSFQEHLRTELSRSRRHGVPVAVALVDVDHFKAVNDTCGHAVGDQVLSAVAALLRDELRVEDVLARIGGDEFAVVLPASDADAAAAALERARRAIALAPVAEGARVSISVGVCDTVHADDAEALARLADGALYWSKENGRNRVSIYDPGTVQELSAGERIDALQRAQALSGLRAMARAIDARDLSTREHSERVAELSARLAEARGWSPERVALLHDAALLHDVGKLAIPDAVLQKRTRLSTAEHEAIKPHAELGARMVEDMLGAEQVDWILSHHERPNGLGYPRGLRGEELSEGAALLAAADAFDVMVSARPYSPSRTAADALAECRALVGQQFSAAAVAALEVVLDLDAAERRAA
ncbi:diguanylate cyclase [Baekduia sp. Peel2402]|uniref:diguanylate cyclase n=1 Tax=Baekduia sp. Peel2402 TaxID=3458296 RepID=UPI00403EF480